MKSTFFSKAINWPTMLFIVFYHLVLLVAIPGFLYYHSLPSVSICIFTCILWFATGLSVTAGYHRLYAHRAYKPHKFMEWVLLFFGSMSVQGSVYSWAYDHRLHHSFSDTDLDPYSVKKGFWHAHLLWMFKKLPPRKEHIVRDLSRNYWVMHQHRYYVVWMLFSNLCVTLLVGWCTGRFLESFLFVWGMRMFLCHHCTWFINSLAHHWGERTFSKEQSAVDNFILSFLTFGEGYHNYHHTFARDYRNGVRWYHFDPTKWLIWTCSKMGITRALHKTSAYRINEKMVIEQQVDLLDRIKRSLDAPQELLVDMVRELFEELMHIFNKLKDPSLQEQNSSERIFLERRLKKSYKIWISLVKSPAI